MVSVACASSTRDTGLFESPNGKHDGAVPRGRAPRAGATAEPVSGEGPTGSTKVGTPDQPILWSLHVYTGTSPSAAIAEVEVSST